MYTRSIPACAGEPNAARPGRGRLPVYPRVCGGTFWISSSVIPVSGLSPRVRGNLVDWPETMPYQRSIPACAGEPRAILGVGQPHTVYPRVCGGTSVQSLVA